MEIYEQKQGRSLCSRGIHVRVVRKAFPINVRNEDIFVWFNEV